ncbi:MAG: hypothetical protein ABIJ34_02695 [archaeon]
MNSEKYPSLFEMTLSLVGSASLKTGYVSLNRSYSTLKSKIEECGMSMNNFHIVDAVTKSVIPSPTLHENCIYTNSPKDLTRLSIATTKMLRAFGPQYVIFDSISTLLLYVPVDVAGQFLHAITNKVIAFGSRCILLSVEGENEQRLIKSLSMCIDKVVRI